jgi:hypothetical protein
MTEEGFFRVTLALPDGWKYPTTGRAWSEEAVGLANEVLEHVERIGLAAFLRTDGLTVEPPARLTVTANESGSGFGLVITDPNGNVTRK